MTQIKLSVLDQSPVRFGGSSKDALKESLTLAQKAEEWGFFRYWFSEHHNTNSLAGSSPEVLISHIASHTHHIRLGSGGIMLPNHSSLKVAESFRTLEALFPGRIDLGIGRAPGGDRLAAALLNPSNNFNEQDFIQQLIDLQHYLDIPNNFDKQYPSVNAIPLIDSAPELWLLSSSGQSGLFAAHFGMALSFAHFINPNNGPEAVQLYRDKFTPSGELGTPKVNVGVFVFCADTDEKVQQLQKTMDYQLLQLEKGTLSGIRSYEDISKIVFNEAELHRIQLNRNRMIAGTPEQIKGKLEKLAEDYKVDELMIVTITHDFADRLRSYELLSQVFGLTVGDNH